MLDTRARPHNSPALAIPGVRAAPDHPRPQTPPIAPSRRRNQNSRLTVRQSVLDPALLPFCGTPPPSVLSLACQRPRHRCSPRAAPGLPTPCAAPARSRRSPSRARLSERAPAGVMIPLDATRPPYGGPCQCQLKTAHFQEGRWDGSHVEPPAPGCSAVGRSRS